MRRILLPFCALAAIGASASATPDAVMPGYTQPAQRWPNVEQTRSERLCADRIEQVRDATGEPMLDRAPASSETPMLIAAVDKRIDGCAVLQMKDDVNDLRPVPVPRETPVVLKPAR
jgi:hypothetical protein